MTLESIRKFCKSLPHTTEDIKWGHDLCFLIGGKMFAVASLDQTEGHCLSFKCTPEEFVELIEISGVVPAPYMARNHWVMLERYDALRDAEVEERVRRSYAMVRTKLTKSALAGLGEGSPRRHGDTEKAKEKSTKAKAGAKAKAKAKAKAPKAKAKAKD